MAVVLAASVLSRTADDHVLNDSSICTGTQTWIDG